MTAPNALVAAEVARMQAEINDLRALVATCVCPSWPPEGPSEECPVHGAVRAFNEATAEIAAMRPVVDAARGLMSSWVETNEWAFIPVQRLMAAIQTFERIGTGREEARQAPTAIGVGEETPGPLPTAELSAEDLSRSTSKPEPKQISTPQVAQAVAEANTAIRLVFERTDQEKQRAGDLAAELGRHLAVASRTADHAQAQVKRVQALVITWCASGKVGEAQDLQDALHPKEAEVAA